LAARRPATRTTQLPATCFDDRPTSFHGYTRAAHLREEEGLEMTDAGARPWAFKPMSCYFVVVEPVEEPEPLLAPPTSSFAGLLVLLLELEPDEPEDPSVDDLLAALCAAFFADSYSDLLNCPSLFLSY